MSRCWQRMLGGILLVAVVAPCEGRPLNPVKQIGVGWQAEKFGWMSFVSFNADGTMVASDAPATPDDVSGNLTFWTFPEGRLVRRLSVRASLSSDWKYYATSHDVGELESGRPLISAPEPMNVTVAFSPDGRYLAESSSDHRRAIIQSLALGGGYVSKPAFSPDGRLVAVGVYGTGTVWLIDVSTGTVLDHEQVSDLGCGSVAFSPDGKYLITPSTGGLIRWPRDRGGTIRVFQISDH